MLPKYAGFPDFYIVPTVFIRLILHRVVYVENNTVSMHVTWISEISIFLEWQRWLFNISTTLTKLTKTKSVIVCSRRRAVFLPSASFSSRSQLSIYPFQQGTQGCNVFISRKSQVRRTVWTMLPASHAFFFVFLFFFFMVLNGDCQPIYYLLTSYRHLLLQSKQRRLNSSH